MSKLIGNFGDFTSFEAIDHTTLSDRRSLAMFPHSAISGSQEYCLRTAAVSHPFDASRFTTASLLHFPFILSTLSFDSSDPFLFRTSPLRALEPGSITVPGSYSMRKAHLLKQWRRILTPDEFWR
jgi:hypothetical protein